MEPGPGKGITALVTGGYKNIGLEISRKLLSVGYHVTATYRSDENRALEASERYGIDIIHADISRLEDVSSLFKRIREKDLRVGVLVNNVSSFPRGPLKGMDPEDFRGAFESCVFSTFYATEEALKDMESLGWGRIVNITMANTSKAKGYRTVAAHAAAKTALAVLTLSYALELEGSGITVNAVGPGMVGSEFMTEEERKRLEFLAPSSSLPTGEDVAAAVLDLVVNPNPAGRIIDIV